MENLVFLPDKIRKYTKDFEYDVLPLISMPDDLIPIFIEYRKNFRKSIKNVLIDKTKILDDEKNDDDDIVFDAALLAILHLPVKIPENLIDFVKYNHNTRDYIYSDNIPDSLMLSLSSFKEKVETYFLEIFESYFTEDIELELEKKILKDIKKEKYPKSLFKYIRYNENYIEPKRRIPIDSNIFKCETDKIIVSSDMPVKMESYFKDFKNKIKRQEDVREFIDKRKSLKLPPKDLFGYIKYDKYNYTIFPKDNMPESLIPVFEEYKKYIEDVKSKYQEEAKTI